MFQPQVKLLISHLSFLDQIKDLKSHQILQMQQTHNFLLKNSTSQAWSPLPAQKVTYIGRFITKNKSTILYTAIYMRKERSKMHTLREVKKKNRRGLAI